MMTPMLASDLFILYIHTFYFISMELPVLLCCAVRAVLFVRSLVRSFVRVLDGMGTVCVCYSRRCFYLGGKR